MAGVAVPLVEPGILASVIVLGLLVLAAARLPVAARRGAGRRLRPPARPRARRRAARRRPRPITYAAGFALATALLHAIGLGLAWLAATRSRPLLVRGAGALVAAAGVALAVI